MYLIHILTHFLYSKKVSDVTAMARKLAEVEYRNETPEYVEYMITHNRI